MLLLDSRTTLFENDSSRKETYKQKQVAHFLVQRNPSQRIKMGTRGGMLKEYQLPYKNAIRVPIFTPSTAVPPKDLYRSPSPSEYKSIMEFETIAKGVCSDKQEIFEITKDLPKVSQPIRVNFRASSLISPTRDFSHSFRGWKGRMNAGRWRSNQRKLYQQCVNGQRERWRELLISL